MAGYSSILLWGLLLLSHNSLASAAATPTTREPLSFLPVLASLTLVVGAILVLAYFVKKMNLGFPGAKAIKVVSALSLGTKERIVVIEVNGKQHLIGVTPQQVNHLFALDEPINPETTVTKDNQPLTFQKILQKVSKQND